MPDVPNERREQDEPEPKPQRPPGEGAAGKRETNTLAQSPRDGATGAVRQQDGPMERPGTEAEEDGR